MTPIYLDNNATTRIHPSVARVMTECYELGYLNPASQHQSGRSARRILEQAREQITSLLGASLESPRHDSMIFTSGGTESNNLAIRGLVRPDQSGSDSGEILVSSIEHPSALEAAKELASLGFNLRHIPVNEAGFVSPKTVEEMISPATKLVVLMLGNNEVGSLQPVEDVAKLCSANNIPLHCDAVQAVGKLSVNFGKLGVSSLALTAHKFHGPRGIGALLIRHGIQLQPLLVGGAQQLGIRPGTESVALAAGMAKALELAVEDIETRSKRLSELRDRLQKLLLNHCDCVVNGQEPRLPHTLNLSFPKLDRQALVMALDLAGVECSTGSACTSGSSEPSHVLQAMGLDQDRIQGSIRFSVSHFSTTEEVTDASTRIVEVVDRLSQQK